MLLLEARDYVYYVQGDKAIQRNGFLNPESKKITEVIRAKRMAMEKSVQISIWCK